MRFQLLTYSAGNRQSARFDESLIALAANEGPVASVWEAQQGLVVPRTYQRYERFNEVCQSFEKQAWPITVRQSGGGIVPQGPGIINLSLAYAVDGLPLDHSNAAYELICRVIQQALRKLDIDTQPQAVTGSFCDGRYNLAWGLGDAAKKIAGTAQLWRRVTTPSPMQIGLVHALILAGIDVNATTERINRFERELDSGKHYDARKIASLHECQTATAPCCGEDFTYVLTRLLIDELSVEWAI
ncbi:MAG TPA: lipoate--protein ligase family protein [Eoetvoesiella sp.]